MLLVLVDIGIAVALAGLVVAPILVYRARVLPYLARRGAGPATYAIAAVPMVLAIGLGAWLLRGWFVGWPAVHPGAVAFALLLLLLVSGDSDLLGWLSRHRVEEDPVAPQQHGRARVALAAAAAGVFVTVAVPLSLRPIEDGWGCAGVELALPANAPVALGEPLPLDISLDAEPEPGAILIQWATYDLEAAADSRHDPSSRQHLVNAGFLGGARRGWQTATADDTWITADVFEFSGAEGAMRYQRAVNRYACPWADAFGAPRDGIGLRVERQEGWVEDQVSWVSGARRYRVSVFYRSAPLDHGRILAIAERMEEGSEQ